MTSPLVGSHIDDFVVGPSVRLDGTEMGRLSEHLEY
jgi:hypothetical protein